MAGRGLGGPSSCRVRGQALAVTPTASLRGQDEGNNCYEILYIWFKWRIVKPRGHVATQPTHCSLNVTDGKHFYLSPSLFLLPLLPTLLLLCRALFLFFLLLLLPTPSPTPSRPRSLPPPPPPPSPVPPYAFSLVCPTLILGVKTCR